MTGAGGDGPGSGDDPASGSAERPAGRLDADAFRAIYDHSPDGVLFSIPDGRVLGANQAACEILGRSEDEILRTGRVGMTDHDDGRWRAILEERARTGLVRGVARMIRGDGTSVEVEMSSRIFDTAEGEQRVCTVLRNVTERVRMELDMKESSSRLRALTITDDLTGLRNRRGFVSVASQMLELADRQQSVAVLLFLDIDNMKELNDQRGHQAGDAALGAVATALSHVLRGADTVARIGGDEFVALALGLEEDDRDAIEARLHDYLATPTALALVGQRLTVSTGWAARAPGDPKTVEELMSEADRNMYRAKAGKGGRSAGGVHGPVRP